MPTYEFRCQDCDHVYTLKATVEEKKAGLSTVCPECGSREAQQVFGGFLFLKTGRAERVAAGPGCNPATGCCGPRR